MGVTASISFIKPYDRRIHKIFFNEYTMRPSFYEKVANISTFKDKQGKEVRKAEMSSIGAMRTLGHGERITYDSFVEGNEKAIEFTKYGLGIQITEDTVEDDFSETWVKAPKELAKSANYKIDTVFFDLINSGLATHKAWDGNYLFVSSGRTTLKTNEANNNRISGDPALSETALQAMFEYCNTAKDSAGRYIHLKPELLLIPEAQRWTAKTLKLTEKKVDSMDNNINTIANESWDYLVVPHFTTTTRFVLLTDQHDLELIWRKKISLKSSDDFDTGSALYKTTMRFAVGCWDPVGMVCSNGA
jgi:phage major head subunit gpT-like protein